MMTTNGLTIANARLVFPGEAVRPGSLRIADGKIAALETARSQPGDTVIEANGHLVTPGLIDVHMHGIRTHQFDGSQEAILTGLMALPSYGTTCVFPTFVPQNGFGFLERLNQLTTGLKSNGARVGGFQSATTRDDKWARKTCGPSWR